MMASDRGRWEQEWKLYEELRGVPLSEEVPEGAPDAAAGLEGTVSMRKRSEAGERLWGAIDEPGGGGADFLTASSSMLAEKLGKGGVKAGEVRHLAPELVPDMDREVFVLILEENGGEVLVAGFTPFSLPASSEELLTGVDMEGLRVLALWNCRWLKRGMVERSWKVDVELGSLAADGAALREARMKDEPVPVHLADRVGPEVVAPDDPRWDYFEKEGAYLVRIGTDIFMWI